MIHIMHKCAHFGEHQDVCSYDTQVLRYIHALWPKQMPLYVQVSKVGRNVALGIDLCNKALRGRPKGYKSVIVVTSTGHPSRFPPPLPPPNCVVLLCALCTQP